jgi:uncharacterized protein (DUF1800 family)
MKRSARIQLLIIASIALVLSSFSLNTKSKLKFPYAQAGLTDRQAAAHLLGRFTFGAKPGDIDNALEMGLENWFTQQLAGGVPDPVVTEKLRTYDALTLTNTQALALFPDAGELRKMALQEGVITKDSLTDLDKKEYKEELKAYALSKGFREVKELHRQFISQKIIRAADGSNQLHEVLTDFWFNHFNVSFGKKQCAMFIPAYERDVIRSHVSGKFQDLLLATAKSPAMLFYLDNFSSVGTNERFEKVANNKIAKRKMAKELDLTDDQMAQREKKKKTQGLNENYAREVMELHTLGVDGGYTQKDVTEAARVLTGWTVYPMGKSDKAANIQKLMNKVGNERLANNGFVQEGDFLFAMNRHDSKKKTVLGHTFSGGGYQEGVDLLSLLAHHSSTAKFISKKLAVRFVSDTPPQSIIDKMAKTFLDTDGNISEVLTTLVSSAEFWSAESLRAKTKSPFEYAISGVRALNGNVKQPWQLNNWITKMGQKLYYYQAPTGFPDKGPYWINTGSLLNRMNFGLALAGGRVPGIIFDLAALNNNHEPESALAALPIYARLMLPERNLDPTLKRLTPFINHPTLERNVDKASKEKLVTSDSLMSTDKMDEEVAPKPKNKTIDEKNMLAQVVGIIIGSPEFQRR